VPDLVATKDRKGLSSMDIVAVLAKVVQQQQAQLADQRKELDALKAQVATGSGNR
jgi:cell division protein FtsB